MEAMLLALALLAAHSASADARERAFAPPVILPVTELSAQRRATRTATRKRYRTRRSRTAERRKPPQGATSAARKPSAVVHVPFYNDSVMLTEPVANLSSAPELESVWPELEPPQVKRVRTVAYRPPPAADAIPVLRWIVLTTFLAGLAATAAAVVTIERQRHA